MCFADPISPTVAAMITLPEMIEDNRQKTSNNEIHNRGGSKGANVSKWKGSERLAQKWTKSRAGPVLGQGENEAGPGALLKI